MLNGLQHKNLTFQSQIFEVPLYYLDSIILLSGIIHCITTLNVSSTLHNSLFEAICDKPNEIKLKQL